ncbi:hypothetical protein WwAna0463 [Wolbachia endosymbiont of Drosophila ananassae]|nr:hypothetical protein WwAna0463 [Wolbachia endosymbiont of Drosophila ananassae]
MPLGDFVECFGFDFYYYLNLVGFDFAEYNYYFDFAVGYS